MHIYRYCMFLIGTIFQMNSYEKAFALPKGPLSTIISDSSMYALASDLEFTKVLMQGLLPCYRLPVTKDNMVCVYLNVILKCILYAVGG